MAGIKSRRKGVTGEQQVVKILREALGGEWSRKKIGVPGPDIETPKWFEYAIEVKNEASVHAIHIFKGSAKLELFWEQASAQADALDLFPLLICKMDGVWLCSRMYGHWSTLEVWIADYKVSMGDKGKLPA